MLDMIDNKAHLGRVLRVPRWSPLNAVASLEQSPGTGRLAVSLELGAFDCDFLNLRLIRRSDYAILIPQIDPSR
jgi:hypothetical protein